jgi:hypothetical protein
LNLNKQYIKTEKKERRVIGLSIANKEIIFQNDEKAKRAAELIKAKLLQEKSILLSILIRLQIFQIADC